MKLAASTKAPHANELSTIARSTPPMSIIKGDNVLLRWPKWFAVSGFARELEIERELESKRGNKQPLAMCVSLHLKRSASAM